MLKGARFVCHVFTIETDYPSETDNPSSKSVKIDEKNRWIKSGGLSIPKLRPFHLKIKTHIIYLT